MESLKHNKGEWILEKKSDKLINISKKEINNAYTDSIIDVWNISGMSDDEFESTAKVVLVSRELLEKLILAKEHIEHLVFMFNHRKHESVDSSEFALEIINNVINKATK